MEPKFFRGSPTDPACMHFDKMRIIQDYQNFTNPFVSKLDRAQEIFSWCSLLFVGGRSSIYKFFIDHPSKPIIESKDRNLGALSFTFTNSPTDLFKKIKNYTLIPRATIVQKRDIRVRNEDGSRKNWQQSLKDVKAYTDARNATYTILEIFQAEGPRYESIYKNLPHLVFHTAREMVPWTVLGIHMAELFFATLERE
ncbi:MAG: hypothetical protein JNM83_06180 [Myxococcales bacterium]|nr:hypothetical protein [Myxococcales bacterium]